MQEAFTGISAPSSIDDSVEEARGAPPGSAAPESDSKEGADATAKAKSVPEYTPPVRLLQCCSMSRV